MSSIYTLKPRFQALLRPVSRRLHAWGITPNMVTLLALVLSIACGSLICFSTSNQLILLVLPFFSLVRMALNALDGMIAREHALESVSGAILNELGDVLADLGLYVPLCLRLIGLALPAGPTSFLSMMVTILVACCILVEFVGVLGSGLCGHRQYHGPFGKSDRAAYFSVVAFIYAFRLPTNFEIQLIIYISILLSIITVIRRAKATIVQPKEASVTTLL